MGLMDPDELDRLRGEPIADFSTPEHSCPVCFETLSDLSLAMGVCEYCGCELDSPNQVHESGSESY